MRRILVALLACSPALACGKTPGPAPVEVMSEPAPDSAASATPDAAAPSAADAAAPAAPDAAPPAADAAPPAADAATPAGSDAAAAPPSDVAAAPAGDATAKAFVAPAETVPATIEWACALFKKPPDARTSDEYAFLKSRKAFLRDAITRPADRVAMLDAFEACTPEAPLLEPTEPDTWETALQDSKYAVGFSADGKTFVQGTVDCDRLDRWKEYLTKSPIGPKAKSVDITRAQADALAPPLTTLVAHQFLSLHDALDLDYIAYQRIGALSFLTTNRCNLQEGITESEITDNFDCEKRVEVRVKGGPVGTFHQSSDKGPSWEAERVEIYARANVPAIAFGLVRGGDHGCGTFEFTSYAVPADIASAVNTLALTDLQAGRLAEARGGFEAALAIDPAATLARYNLACTLALLELPAESAGALAPLLAKDAPDRKTWLGKVAKDKDFDKIRASAELKAVLGAP